MVMVRVIALLNIIKVMVMVVVRVILLEMH